MEDKKNADNTKPNSQSEKKELSPQEEYFEEDVVCMTDESGQKRIGFITKLGWEESSDEEDEDEYEDEDEEDDEKTPEDEVEVLWADRDFGSYKPSQLEILDRAFLHGDIVCRRNERGGQSGTVIGVETKVDLVMPSGNELNQISTKNIKQTHAFHTDAFVLRDQWLGRVVGFTLSVQVKFSDGSICLVKDATVQTLVPVEDDDDEIEDQEYYPSRKVEATPKFWKKAKWIKGHFKGLKKGLVCSVFPYQVQVDWMITQSKSDTDRPESLCDPQGLVILDHFMHTYWALGDHAILSEDTENTDEPDCEEVQDDISRCGLITCTYTNVDVCWQDGTISKSIASKDLSPVQNVVDDDFWPQDFVKSKNDDKKLGVVKSVRSKERLCNVIWVDEKALMNKDPVLSSLLPKSSSDSSSTSQEVATTNESSFIVKEEEVPIYFLVNSDEFDFSLGDVVIKLAPLSAQNNSEASSNAWAGEIIDMKDGLIKVHWADHVETWTVPFQLYKVDEDDFAEDEDDDIYMDEDDEDEEEEEEEEEENQNQRNEERSPAWWGESEMTSETLRAFRGISLGPDGDIPSSYLTSAQPSSHAIPESNVNEEKSNGSELRFETVETVEGCDHHFKDRETLIADPKIIARIMKEWVILKKSLPDGVFIRSYEDRIDLLKILIIGPPGTPYHNCIFVFDLHIPSDYPLSPPELHFRSQGPKLNPNLYTNGRVCLSLLGTWTGKGTENWIEGESNILQLVVSVQGLILGSAQPYFLEAGYDKLKGTVQGEHHSKLYNESALILSLETIPLTISHPPPDFADVVREHFKNKKDVILATCKDFVKQRENSTTTEDQPSLGFIKAIEILLPKLEEAFKKL